MARVWEFVDGWFIAFRLLSGLPYVAEVTALRQDNEGKILLTLNWMSRWCDLFKPQKDAVKKLTHCAREHDHELFRTDQFDIDQPAESVLGECRI